MPSVWNEILYHFDLALSICSKFPYSTQGNQRINWAASLPPVQMSHHWCGAGKAPQWQSALTHWLYMCTLLGRDCSSQEERGAREERSLHKHHQGIRDAPSPCAHHICEANAALAPFAEQQLRCVGAQRIAVPKGFGCSHHRLPSEAHSSSSDLPRCRKGACGRAGNEPKSGLSPALELAFAMLPLNTKLASLGKVSLQDFPFIWLHSKLAYARHIGRN